MFGLRKSRSSKDGLEILCRRRQGRIISLEVRGHAGFAVIGKDIVCAAVSALVLSAAEGLKAHSAAKVAIVDTQSTYRLNVDTGNDERGQAVLETTLGGLRAIEAAYPRHLVVKESHRAAPASRTGPRSPREKSAARPRKY